MSELFDAVDALLASRATLPPPAERKRLRAAHGLTIDEVATALKVRRATVSGWEAGKTEPRPPERDAYARLLDKLAELYPAAPADTATPAPAEARTLSTEEASETAAMTAPENTQTSPTPVSAAPAAAPRPAPTTRTSSTSRRPGAKKAAPAGTPAGGADPRFENGPLAVIDLEDGQVLAYCTGGLVLDVPAKSIPALVDWTLREAKLGQPKLAGPGKDADPLIVLTEAALERYGLPVTLTEEEKHAGRIPEGHKVIKQLTRAEWKLTKRGFGPWARIYRPATGSERACVQLCIPSWNALDTRHWGEAGQLPCGGARPRPGRVRLAGDDAARLDRRDGPGADDRPAPADARLPARRQRQAALRAQPRLAGQGRHRPDELAAVRGPRRPPRPQRPAPLPHARTGGEALRGGVRLGPADDRRRVHPAAPGRPGREHGLRRPARTG